MNKKTTQIISVVGLIILTPITILALWNGGLIGVWDAVSHNWASLQIYIDLVIAIIFILAWVWDDAKKSGRNPWPWIISAFVVGSFSPILYFLTRKSSD